MPAINNPFSPNSPTLRVAATATSAGGAISQDSNQLRIYNLGPNKVFVRWGSGAQTALTTDLPIPPGGVEVFTVGTGRTNVAAICDASETATVFFTTGEGA